MNQSTKIVGFLIAAFFIFITTRGELPTYLGFLFGTTNGNTSQPASTTSQSLNLSNIAAPLAQSASIGTALTALVA